MTNQNTTVTESVYLSPLDLDEIHLALTEQAESARSDVAAGECAGFGRDELIARADRCEAIADKLAPFTDATVSKAHSAATSEIEAMMRGWVSGAAVTVRDLAFLSQELNIAPSTLFGAVDALMGWSNHADDAKAARS